MANHTGVEEQLQASLITEINNSREQYINDAQQAIDATLKHSILNQERAFDLAMDQVNKTRADIGNLDGILGSIDTKHGEIAEKVEVGIRNAQQALRQEVNNPDDFSATFEGVGRTAPEDYLIDG